MSSKNGADEALLRAAVRPEFQKKTVAEASWPSTTDCDRLDQAFAELNARWIIALQNAGYTMSDGLSDVSEALRKGGRKGVVGYCFYHGQDLERAVAGGGLMLAFGDLHDERSKRAEIGRCVRDVLESHGLTVQWNGDSEKRLSIPNIDWKRRFNLPKGQN